MSLRTVPTLELRRDRTSAGDGPTSAELFLCGSLTSRDWGRGQATRNRGGNEGTLGDPGRGSPGPVGTPPPSQVRLVSTPSPVPLGSGGTGVGGRGRLHWRGDPVGGSRSHSTIPCPNRWRDVTSPSVRTWTGAGRPHVRYRTLDSKNRKGSVRPRLSSDTDGARPGTSSPCPVRLPARHSVLPDPVRRISHDRVRWRGSTRTGEVGEKSSGFRVSPIH